MALREVVPKVLVVAMLIYQSAKGTAILSRAARFRNDYLATPLPTAC